MRRTMLHSKIHRATISDVNINYEGSISIDSMLMEAANILPNEQVHLWNITRGTRLVTYCIPHLCEPGAGFICVNGSAGHGNYPGNVIIIATFVDVEEDKVRNHIPYIILVNDKINLNTDWEVKSEPERNRECL